MMATRSTSSKQKPNIDYSFQNSIFAGLTFPDVPTSRLPTYDEVCQSDSQTSDFSVLKGDRDDDVTSPLIQSTFNSSISQQIGEASNTLRDPEFLRNSYSKLYLPEVFELCVCLSCLSY